MLKNQFLRTTFVGVLVIGGIWAFAPADQRLPMIAALVGLIGTVFVGMWPPVTTIILKWPRATLRLGILLVVLGVGPIFLNLVAITLGIAWPDPLGSPAGQALMMLPTVAGVAMSTLPRSLKAAADAKANPQSAKAPPSRSAGLDEAKEAFALLIRERIALLRIVGPWFLMFCVLPVALLAPLIGKDDAATKAMFQHLGLGALSLILIASLTVMLSLPALAAIQWSRFVATRTAPRLTDVPARALFGFAWRYIIFGAILRFPDQLGPWMKLHVPQAAPWMISTTTSLVGLMFLALVSPWAMVLPAIALGDKDKTMVTAARRAKTLGRGYYIGALVILAPLTILSWLLDVVPAAPEGSYFGIVWILAWAAALFLTACAGMSYLTNISLGRPAAAAGSQGA